MNQFKITLDEHTDNFVCIEELVLKQLVDALESKDELQRTSILSKLDNSPIYNSYSGLVLTHHFTVHVKSLRGEQGWYLEW